MEVVCAILYQKNNLLLAQRPSHKKHGDLWEFPGGKVKHGESHEEALSRELFEELHIQTLSFYYIGSTHNEDLNLHTYISPLKEAYIPIEHRAVSWLSLKNLQKSPLCPSDLEIINLYSKKIESFLTL